MNRKKDSSRLDVRDLTDPTTWMVPYGTLVTMLMIFFTVLYSYAYHGSVRYEKMLSSLSKESGKVTLKEEKETELAKKVEDYIQEKGLKEFAKVEMNAEKVKISLTNPVLFDIGAAELKKEAFTTLNEIIKYLQGMDNPIIVEGHTDNIPIRGGRYRSNWELSAARAFSVIRYFIDKDIKPERPSALGYGEYRPVAPNDTEENRAKNRRIEITVLRTQTKG